MYINMAYFFNPFDIIDFYCISFHFCLDLK